MWVTYLGNWVHTVRNSISALGTAGAKRLMHLCMSLCVEVVKGCAFLTGYMAAAMKKSLALQVLIVLSLLAGIRNPTPSPSSLSHTHTLLASILRPPSLTHIAC